MHFKNPNDIVEIREKIAAIDRQIVFLLRRRTDCTNREQEVGGILAEAKRAEEYEKLITRIREIAISTGTDPVLAEKIYQVIMDHPH